MNAKIITLTNESGAPVAPRTSAAAVFTESGESVQEALNSIGQSGGGGGIAELPGTLTYWSESESAEFGDISTPADTVKMASGKTLESVLAGCWIEFADKDGNPTTEPYIHWYAPAPEVVLISFTVEGTSYQAEEGMTWAEWIESDYNTSSSIINSEGSVKTTTGSYVTYNGSGIPVSDAIVADGAYGQIRFP